MTTKLDRPLSITQIAERWDCSDETVRSLVKSGKLPGFRLGRMIRVQLRHVLEMERGRESTASPLSWTPTNDGELWQKALDRASAFEDSKRLRALLDEMESQRHFLKSKIDGVPSEKYMEWLRGKIDQLNPMEEITEGKPLLW
ncbi:helix-turn-helix domain-containing protein [uncultured Ruegeria sp.]|uniref:helix-turn-helix domain-containing protein n=1 Tax=uncultured Ruegeria sp. TaxID=259304 RepID=UPI00261E7625|nr:helix-turn-helix domain-containing protein [uncultured Ruegeria sp.]